MLGQPFLTLGQHTGNAQGEALLAEQNVATVAAAHRPDRVVLGKVQNQAAVDVEIGLAVQTLGELALGPERIHHLGAHAGHDAHVEHHIDAVGQLDANLGKGRAHRTHGKRHHVHGAALHGTGEVAARLCIGLARAHPVVGWPGVALEAGADVCEVFGARHIVGCGPVEIACWQLLLIELDELTSLEGLGGETFSFLISAVAPIDAVRLAHSGHSVYPFLNMRILDHGIEISDTNHAPWSTARVGFGVGGPGSRRKRSSVAVLAPAPCCESEWLRATSQAVGPISRVPHRRDSGFG